MIGELAAQGRAILLISSELPELLALCDRVLVMSEGRLTADIPRAEATQEAIMQAAVPRSQGGGGMSALRILLLRREAGIAVMIVLFCLAVGAVEAAVPDARPAAHHPAADAADHDRRDGADAGDRRAPCRPVDRLDAGRSRPWSAA